jgi:hypothetical protein
LLANGRRDQRLFLAADAVESRAGSELDRIATRRWVLDIVDAAVAAAGLPGLAWNERHGCLAELHLDDTAVLDRLVAELDAVLVRHNVTRRLADRLRLRVAVHYGQNGRLVDAAVLHRAMRLCPHAYLGLLLAADVFDGLGTRLRQEWLRGVRITTPTFTGTAWLFIPGHDVHALRLRGVRLPRARAPSGRVVQYQAEGVP